MLTTCYKPSLMQSRLLLLLRLRLLLRRRIGMHIIPLVMMRLMAKGRSAQQPRLILHDLPSYSLTYQLASASPLQLLFHALRMTRIAVLALLLIDLPSLMSRPTLRIRCSLQERSGF